MRYVSIEIQIRFWSNSTRNKQVKIQIERIFDWQTKFYPVNIGKIGCELINKIVESNCL